MNYIWFFIILISIVSAIYTGRIENVVNAILSGAQKSIEIAIYLAGIMAFWLGIMKIAEKSGLINIVAKFITPIAKLLFPNIPKENPAIGSITMNITASAFGLANAATPIGLKAMEELQEINKDKNTASNEMCTLLAMNTASFQLIPTSVIAILAACGSKSPTEIVLPTLIVTTIAFISAILIAKTFEKMYPPQIQKEEIEEMKDV